MRLATVTLVTLSSMRLTRLVTTDSLGDWCIRRPAEAWANDHEVQAIVEGEPDDYDETDPISWQKRLVSGLGCPHCLSFHAAWLILLGNVLAPRIPVVRQVWPFMLKALAVSAVVGHVNARID